MYDVVAIGELLIDFVPLGTEEDGYPVLGAKPGGAPGNYLATLAAYGAKTAFLGKVGADEFGKLLIETLKKAGVETSGIAEDPAVFTTLAFVTLDDGGNRAFSFARKPGADTCLRFGELNLSFIDDAKILHFGTLSLTDEPSCRTTKKAVEYAKKRNKLISFDPNLRPSLWRNLEDAREQILWGLGQADIVKISGEEVEFLWKGPAKESIPQLLGKHGVALAMVTMGQDGCYLANENATVFSPAPPVKTLDTTGAGDIFGGSAVSRMLKLEKHPAKLEEEELAQIAAFASAAASLSTGKKGAIPSIPSEEEVRRLLKKRTLLTGCAH